MNCRAKSIIAPALAAIMLLLAGCGVTYIAVPDGAGGTIDIELLKDLPVSDYDRDCFSRDGEYVEYRDGNEKYVALRGMDVSEHQQEIDWNAVKGDGLDFAVIRAGYRGYSEGTLAEDLYFRDNMAGARAANLDIGIYFFSQAVTADEARAEAEYLLELIDGYEVTLPVFYDWEPISYDGSRTAETDGKTVTDCCIAFCETIKAAGYEPGVYFYRTLGYHFYELQRLAQYTFWAAAPGEYPDFYYAHSFWQYSYTAQVNGIEGDADLDLMFVPVATEGENKK